MDIHRIIYCSWCGCTKTGKPIPLIVVCSSLLCMNKLCLFLDQCIVKNGLKVKEKSTHNPVLRSKEVSFTMSLREIKR